MKQGVIDKNLEDYVPGVCYGCYNHCGTKVLVKEKKIIDIIGDPKDPNSLGHLCAKGKARIMDLYDPNRVKTPLRRTNPEKGIEVDPQWEEISWEEAFDVIVKKLSKVRDDDPRKLIIASFDLDLYSIGAAFGTAFGTPNYFWNRADYCGGGAHNAWLLVNGTLNSEINFEHCEYLILWGTQMGFGLDANANSTTLETAKARKRGMKLVVIDPVCTNAAAKADEWIPIKPGTDGALALGILNHLLNGLEVYDREFLRKYSNATYLIGEDGHYLRDKKTQKPLIWDKSDGQAKVYDDKTIKEAAIEGVYEINGKNYEPSLETFKNHVKKYNLDLVSEITTIPVATIKKLTEEIAKAAKIGSTIDIDGTSLPFRPFAINFKKGAGAHKGGMWTCLSIHLIQVMLGAIEVPGGHMGVNSIGPFWGPRKGKDGLLECSQYIAHYHKPFPASEVKKPECLDLREIFPVALFTRAMYPFTIADPERYGIPYKPEILLHCRTNLMMNSHNAKMMEESLKKIPFMVSFCRQIDETSEFADIILPDTHELERDDLFAINDPYAWIVPGPGNWYWQTRRSIVEPAYEARNWGEVLFEMAARLGILRDMNRACNITIGELEEPFKLDPEKKYTIREIAELQGKSVMGPEFHFDDFKEKRTVIQRKKNIEESFPSLYHEGKIPIYFEYLIAAGDDVRKVTEFLKFDWDTSVYKALPDFIPCNVLEESGEEYEFIITNYKFPFHTFSISGENPWIDEVSSYNPYTYRILMNREVANRKGIKDGDLIWVESDVARVKGLVKVTELIHPEVIGIGGTFGHWAKNKPISRGKGVNYNDLLAPSFDKIDPLTGQTDQCARVKVYKATE